MTRKTPTPKVTWPAAARFGIMEGLFAVVFDARIQETWAFMHGRGEWFEQPVDALWHNVALLNVAKRND